MDTTQLITSPLTTENGAVAVWNALDKFRDGFALGFDSTIWDESWSNQGTGFRTTGGNSVGASYLLTSMCPFTPNMEYTLTSKSFYKMPIRFWYGFSMSQRILGQEVEVSLVGCTSTWTIEKNSTFSPLTISGTVTIATNVATVVFATPHGLKGGDRVCLVWNTENRLNVWPVLVTVVDSLTITVPCTLANGTYTAGGQVVWADAFAYVKNAVGLLHENATATNASFNTRRNGTKTFSTNTTIATTTALQANTSAYTEWFRSAQDTDVIYTMEHVKFSSRPASALTAPSGGLKYTESLPDEEKYYKICVRIKNLPNLSTPIAEIASISKSGTTTATVTTLNPIWLANGTYFGQVYGVRDQVNFPNLTVTTSFTVTGTNTFTVLIGTATTTSSTGWVLVLNQWSTLLPGALNFSIQSIVRTNNIMTVQLNTTAAGLLPGEYVHLYWMDGSATIYDGAYKVLRLTTTFVEVESVGANFWSINCGGAIIKRTDVRLHYLRLLDYTRLLMEISNNRGQVDAGEAIPVSIPGGSSVSISSWTITSVTSSQAAIPGIIADIASTAITTTTTTAAVTPSYWTSYTISIPVTLVSGTNPTMDVGIEESDDSGTNWVRVYDFERITATGMYRSPPLTLRGNRIRYVQTIAGTTPSFTRALNRLQSSAPGLNTRSFIDRSILPNTLNSVTPTYNIEGCDTINIIAICSAQTTPATLTLEFSDNGANWFTSSVTITTAVWIVQAKSTNEQWKFARLNVTTAGTGITLSLASIKAKSIS